MPSQSGNSYEELLMHPSLYQGCRNRSGLGYYLVNPTARSAVDIARGSLRCEYPKAGTVVLDLIKPSHSGRGKFRNQYYSREEVEKVIAELALCKERKAEIKTLSAHILYCEAWMEQDRQRRVNELNELRQSRLDAIIDHLRVLGYSDDDFSEVCNLSCARSISPLTNPRLSAGWGQIKSGVLACVHERRTKALIHDQNAILTARRKAFDRLYSDFKKTLEPLAWQMFPRNEVLYLLPTINKLLVSPDDTSVTDEDFRHGLRTIPEEVSLWINICSSLLSNMEAGARDWMLRAGNERFLLADVFPPPIANTLSLATTIFQCQRLLFVHHFICARPPVSKHLVTISGLDPDTATPDRMDEIGTFYACLGDDIHLSFSYVGTWRECIRSHQFSDCSQLPRFQKLNRSPSNDARVCWTCNRCDKCAEVFATRAQIIEHLFTEHKVSKPHVPWDFYAGY
ncbi:hypothetical protein WG66_005721 [Moniliophthora roreri]|nr:hypothetical protein WG66_005721 [Moniliophthora roreri]